MRKSLFFLAAALLAICMNISWLGQAEAAWVAVVPIQVDDTKVERSGDFNSYYWDIMVERFQYPEYELIQDEKVDKVLPESGRLAFDKETLIKVLDKTEADIVVAMNLDETDEEPLPTFSEPEIQCYMKGEFASYNRLTGKYYHKKLYYKDKMEEVLALRTDWQQRVFASELNRFINQTLEEKKEKGKN